MTTYYIVFEHHNDPRGEKPMLVYKDRWDAEHAQLTLQQDRANDFNKARSKAFKEGLGFSQKRTANDYANYYSIKEVQQ